MNCFSCSAWLTDVDRNRCSLGEVDIPDHHDCREEPLLLTNESGWCDGQRTAHA